MIGVIAHQWKQPLNTIGIIVQDLPDSYEYGELDEEMLQTQVDKVMDQVRFLSQTIEDFRNFFKPSKKPQIFPLRQSVEDVYRLMMAPLARRGVEVRITGDEKVCVRGYENELKQVILNLLNNANEALQDTNIQAPLVTINVEASEDKALLVVTDNGVGIPESLLPDQLFEPFASTKGKEGTGIGLSLSRQILEKMGGSIQAGNVGQGARFTVTLPLTCQHEDEASPPLL